MGSGRRPGRPTRSRLVAAVVGVVLLTGLGGCGLGAGAPVTDTRLTITRDFGQVEVERLDDPASAGADTAMRLLQRNADVETRYGGGFVQSIDGVAGGTRDGRTVDWFYFVNGVAPEVGATSYEVEKGDHVWWDHRDWSVTANVKAVVGTFPEPFVHGVEGDRLPVRVECPVEGDEACTLVRDRLVQAGVVPGSGGLRTSLARNTIRVVVGPWAAARADGGARRLERGPDTTGVYARPSADGRRITLLDAQGRETRTLGPGTGLIAATKIDDEAPLWVVTGTDEAGLRAAVGAFNEADLDRAFALVVTEGATIPVPENRGGRDGDAADAEGSDGGTGTRSP